MIIYVWYWYWYSSFEQFLYINKYTGCTVCRLCICWSFPSDWALPSAEIWCLDIDQWPPCWIFLDRFMTWGGNRKGVLKWRVWDDGNRQWSNLIPAIYVFGCQVQTQGVYRWTLVDSGYNQIWSTQVVLSIILLFLHSVYLCSWLLPCLFLLTRPAFRRPLLVWMNSTNPCRRAENPGMIRWSLRWCHFLGQVVRKFWKWAMIIYRIIAADLIAGIC